MEKKLVCALGGGFEPPQPSPLCVRSCPHYEKCLVRCYVRLLHFKQM